MSSSEISSPYPRDLYPNCPCAVCTPGTPDGFGGFFRRMNLCPNCGNKRCPGASEHTNPCSGSNDPRVNDATWEVLRIERGFAFCTCSSVLHAERSRYAGGDEKVTGCEGWVKDEPLCESCKNVGICDEFAKTMAEITIKLEKERAEREAEKLKEIEAQKTLAAKERADIKANLI
jgi:hypothetical protein